ncbi:hypothetical protein, partial [Catenulispora pinisilvae]|uniref:hypothetical protein n=1 Tax=Catenulispora pinisilvae TaxID=2705253 RepID=UPI001E5562CA
SAAGSGVHNPGASQASSTPASWNKNQIKNQINSQIKVNGKVKNCDEEPGASGGGSWLPRGTGAVP